MKSDNYLQAVISTTLNEKYLVNYADILGQIVEQNHKSPTLKT